MRPSAPRPRTLLISSYPPRACGIAVFSRDLRRAVAPHLGHSPAVVALDDGAGHRYGPEVVDRLRVDQADDYARIAAEIDSSADVLSVQHEFGLFGGTDGELLLGLLERVRVPVVTTLHTVLRDPGPHRQAIIKAVADRSAAVVVIARSGVSVLTEVYGVGPSRIRHIPHGVHPPATVEGRCVAKQRLGLFGRTVLSTFGLLGPGKGIEYAVDALPAVVRSHPDLIYLVLGRTHPGEQRHAGESYRNRLLGQVTERGLGAHVMLVDRYLTDAEVQAYLAASDVYLTPYVGAEQASSGTLAYALGAGRVVVATPFTYAKEMLAGGRGVLVPFRDSPALSAALVKLLGDPLLRQGIEARARAAGRAMRWTQVGRAYASLFAASARGADALATARA